MVCTVIFDPAKEHFRALESWKAPTGTLTFPGLVRDKMSDEELCRIEAEVLNGAVLPGREVPWRYDPELTLR